VELQATIDKLRKDNFEKDATITGLVKKSEEYANRLNDMKASIMNKQLTKTSFTVELIGRGKKLIEILFQKTKDDEDLNDLNKEKYEMVIKGRNKKDMEEHINLLDVSEFQIHDKDKNRIDISYTYKEQEESISIKVHELLIDYFYQTYKDFEQKANECI